MNAVQSEYCSPDVFGWAVVHTGNLFIQDLIEAGAVDLAVYQLWRDRSYAFVLRHRYYVDVARRGDHSGGKAIHGKSLHLRVKAMRASPSRQGDIAGSAEPVADDLRRGYKKHAPDLAAAQVPLFIMVIFYLKIMNKIKSRCRYDELTLQSDFY